MAKKYISFFIPHIGRGGVGKVFLTLANEFSKQGHFVELVLTTLNDKEKELIPNNIQTVTLEKDKLFTHRARFALNFFRHINVLIFPFILPVKLSKSQRYITSLSKYLAEKSPDILITAKPHTNITAILAAATVENNTKVIITEHTALSIDIKTRIRKMRWRYIVPAIQKIYPMADEVVTVSKCVESDLVHLISPVRINSKTIYNPINRAAIKSKMENNKTDPFFDNKDHIYILSVGRLEEQKNFSNLLHAFSKVVKRKKAKLIILGEGTERSYLEGLAKSLEIQNDIYMPGHVENPYTYMRQSDLFVLSSNWEGLPTVLLEALICCCNIVSTDCMCGPREILENGKYGTLVPINNHELLSAAMLNAIEKPIVKHDLDSYLEKFTPENISAKYTSI